MALSPALLARLRRLDRWLREGHGATRPGLAGRARTPAAEVAEYRPYQPGDDPRYLDWRVLARLRRPFIRHGEARRATVVVVAVDCSASMGLDRKFEVATEIATALAYLALEGEARLFLHLLGTNPTPVAGGSGRALLGLLAAALEAAKPAGEVAVAAALYGGSVAWPPGAQVVLLSDLLEPVERLAPLGDLARRGHPVEVIQLLGEGDLHPAPTGPCLLLDVESGEGRAAVADLATVARYQAALARHQEGVAALARRHRIGLVVAQAAAGAEAALFAYLRHGGGGR
ncbi:MAG: hypothetical protein COW73_09515 [Nitrospirae bacterium CG18_big_fil_WC_8_21_14_2_50_70_55]|nr:DUF58 domain-containing protein [Deltaproteobacteria bacterium]PIQ03940.1 MAG: hypothetical protein COW73_09515 [Nitrospirae bacterium CG18_big_fil_WC_8_21_14_2_50_70_55]PIX82963.1 MAG: hypothetical protein COZ33_07875 [Nitrospirae bacterium CG_4_10_14_3_um_filter_70_108]PJB97236.1 MAG: hypothetical protein CO080_00670 [Nitrospirae bacterium CG_4_9_14_0_8_um_filter_70_14]NCP95820.1 DUF58 domain-containing protein [Deltaproteobacteria bacterium]